MGKIRNRHGYSFVSEKHAMQKKKKTHKKKWNKSKKMVRERERERERERKREYDGLIGDEKSRGKEIKKKTYLLPMVGRVSFSRQ
jgi:hypothetical protein